MKFCSSLINRFFFIFNCFVALTLACYNVGLDKDIYKLTLPGAYRQPPTYVCSDYWNTEEQHRCRVQIQLSNRKVHFNPNTGNQYRDGPGLEISKFWRTWPAKKQPWQAKPAVLLVEKPGSPSKNNNYANNKPIYIGEEQPNQNSPYANDDTMLMDPAAIAIDSGTNQPVPVDELELAEIDKKMFMEKMSSLPSSFIADSESGNNINNYVEDSDEPPAFASSPTQSLHSFNDGGEERSAMPAFVDTRKPFSRNHNYEPFEMMMGDRPAQVSSKALGESRSQRDMAKKLQRLPQVIKDHFLNDKERSAANSNNNNWFSQLIDETADETGGRGVAKQKGDKKLHRQIYVDNIESPRDRLLNVIDRRNNKLLAEYDRYAKEPRSTATSKPNIFLPPWLCKGRADC